MKKFIMPIICFLISSFGLISAIVQIYLGYAVQNRGKRIYYADQPDIFLILLGVKLGFFSLFFILALFFLWKMKK